MARLLEMERESPEAMLEPAYRAQVRMVVGVVVGVVAVAVPVVVVVVVVAG